MIPRLPTLLTWTVALGCLPFGTRAAPTTNCTNASFQTPAWAIQNVVYSSRVRSGSLRVTNIANNFSLTVLCTVGECSPELGQQKDNPDTQVAVAMIRGALEISINQTWTCDDRRWKDVPINLNFTATGKTSLPARCDDQGACRPVNKNTSLIRGSLLAPLTGTPQYLDPLPGQGLTKCKPEYSDRIWHTRNLRYLERDRPCFDLCEPSPGGVFPPNGGGVEFDLYNYILNQTVHCSGVLFTSYPANISQPATRIECESPAVRSIRKYSTHTFVSFGGVFIFGTDYGMLTVNQTWQCDENGPDKPTQVNVQSVAQIFLTCTRTNGTIELFGQSYPWREMSCAGGDRFMPYPFNTESPFIGQAFISSTDLPPYALEEPLRTPPAGRCLTMHLLTTGWEVSSFGMIVNYTDPSTGMRRDTAVVTVGFQANVAQLKAGRANRREVPLLEGTGNVTDGGKWVDCWAPGEKTTAPCRFQFDSVARRLTIARMTNCDDVDVPRVHPYQVTIKASFTVPSLDCSWRSWQPESERDTVVRCGWQADIPNRSRMTLESLSDITWEAMPAGWGADIWDGNSPRS
ncbi:hypothetical protein V8F06_004444 [Rhypophila decipiens]